MTLVLDTNIILRYLTNDHADQSPHAYALFKQVEDGTVHVRLTEAVLVEVGQVLDSKRLYNLPRMAIHRYLNVILSLRGMELPQKRIYLQALDLYMTTPALSFVDALLVQYTEGGAAREILSFDQGFDCVPNLIRREPEPLSEKQ